MEAVVALALAIGFAVVLSSVGAFSIDRAVSALALFFGGWRADGWPRGVQEEDPDRPWGARGPLPARRELSIPERKPTLSVVRPIVRQR